MQAEFAKGPKVVVIGGGTGSFTLLSGLKHYVRDLTALVNMADDGGSTGQLRDELGALPPGDVRQCLVALSKSPQVRELFNYRFENGAFAGHAFGNLFLTALEKMSGSFAKAVDVASEVLAIDGKVLPVTLSDITLSIQTDDGVVTKGEYQISDGEFSSQRPKIWLEPTAVLNPAVTEALERADIIVIAPGNLYGSLAAALIVPGMSEALVAAPGKKIYVANLVTKPKQSDGFKVHDFAAEVERFVGRPFLDYVLYNTSKPDGELFEKYAKDKEFLVEADEEVLQHASYEAKGVDLLAFHDRNQQADPLTAKRSLIRHNGDAVARQIMKLYFS